MCGQVQWTKEICAPAIDRSPNYHTITVISHISFSIVSEIKEMSINYIVTCTNLFTLIYNPIANQITS